MKTFNNWLDEVHEPMYVMEERLLRRNLELIRGVAAAADVEIILAFKAFALWRTFPVFREYIHATTASSLFESMLAAKEFGSPAHTYSPAYTDSDIDEISRNSSHLTFNSLSQYERFHVRAKAQNAALSLGLRVNPRYCEVETDLYNPCAPGTRFGISRDKLPRRLPSDIDGFHCHCHCESGAEVFVRSLKHIEDNFSEWFPQLKWINFGGGHLMTRKDYNVPLLISTLKEFHSRYPWLKVIMEPGSAFAWQTGPLIAQVVDIVEDSGIKTAILNVSFTCHMPDCLEMPYQPDVEGAESLGSGISEEAQREPTIYRLGGNSCLSGDYMGYWRFPAPLSVGDHVVFLDMLHYTTVKTTLFNGIRHPSIILRRIDGKSVVLRRYSYSDYRHMMD